MKDVVVTVYFPSKQGLSQLRKWAMDHQKELNPNTARILKNRETRQLAIVYENQPDIKL